MLKGFYTILLLTLSNVFMLSAWYGHLKLAKYSWFSKLNLFAVIILSWSIALFEYMFQVPANRIGYNHNGGPFSLVQLKVIQEVITLLVFIVLASFVFKFEVFKWNYLLAFCFLVLAVYFVFK